MFVSASLHMCREEKPTRCHCMLYCIYDTPNMFQALLRPSSGALDCCCMLLLPMVCSAWLLAVGVRCRAAECASLFLDAPYIPWLLVVGGQVQGSRVCVQEEGCCTTGLIKRYRGGEWPAGTGGSGRLRIVQE